MDAVAAEWVPLSENLSAQGRTFHGLMTVGGRLGVIKMFQQIVKDQAWVQNVACNVGQLML